MTDATRNLLQQHFNTAFAAPDGVAKLRELILTLAMQGKLVAQNPNDPPASELLKEIEAEKQRLVKAGKIKKPKPLPPIKPEEAPYQLPQGWVWVRLGDLIYLEMGQSPSSEFYNQENNGLPFFQGKADFGSLHPTPRYWCTNPQKYAFLNDVLLSVRAPVGPTNIADVECCIGRGLAALRPLAGIDAKFVNFLMIRFRPALEEKATGTTFVAVSKVDVENLLVPAIPFPEQHRIVTRIDQLMARCDALEKLRKEREEKRLAVHAAAIKQLLDTPDGSAWDFIQQYFGTLYTVKENVAELRKAILQLAVMGRLVPQNPNDPSASELLKEIEAEKQRLVKAGKIKKLKPLPPIKPEEVPYELPQGWEWVRLGDITDIKGGKRVSNGYKLLTTPTPHVYIRVSDMKNGSIDTSDLRYIDEEMQSKIKNYIITKDDIYMTIVGATIGKCGTIPDELDGMNLTENAARLVLFGVDKKFLHNCLDGDFCQNQFVDKTKQVGVQKMALIRLASTLIPLPPLPEQHRIVARIGQLMTLCDTLDQQIDAATGKQTELLNAVMAQV